jgi:hypothetical protein
METELPGMPEPIAAKPGSNAWKVVEFRRFQALSAEEGGLTSPRIAAFVLGVSSQRIHQLLDAGHLRGFKVMGKNYVSCDGLLAFRKLARSSGYRYGAVPA